MSEGQNTAGQTVFINGKFGAQHTTGVQRFAHHIVQALDQQAPSADGLRFLLLRPPEGRSPALQHIEVRTVGPRGLPLHLWEQTVLPLAARDGLLLNLAGSAPLWATRQCVTLHDAAVFDQPHAYTRVFAAWYRTMFRRHAAHAARILTVSRFSQARLSACLQLASDRIGIVHNGGGHLVAVAADERILDLHGLRGRRYLLAVGSANPTKNMVRLERAFAQLSSAPDARLVIVGGANAQVFARSATHPASTDARRLVRTGPLDDAPLKALYLHAQGLVFPSVYEGFGLPPLEAMSCACPVAAAHAASIPEVCGDAALYFDPRSVDDIASALHRLLSDSHLRQQLAAAGPVQAARFTWQKSALQMRAEIQALA